MRPTRSSLVLLGATALACGVLDDGSDGPPVVAPTSVASSVDAMVPLAVGHRWQYQVLEHTAGAPRVVGQPVGDSGTAVVGSVSLEVVAQGGAGASPRYQAVRVEQIQGEDSVETELSLWHQGGALWMDDGSGRALALEVVLPERVVSAEDVRCVAHYLGGAVGECPAMAGGVLQRAPGLDDGVLFAEEGKAGKGIVRWVVGIATLGTLIPGNKTVTRSLALAEFRAGEPLPVAPLPDLWAAWQGRALPDEEAELDLLLAKQITRHGADAESLGLILASTLEPSRVVTLTNQGLHWLPESERGPVLRTALPRLQGSFPPLALLATWLPSLGALSEADQAAFATRVEGRLEVAQVQRMVSGDCPALVQTYRTAESDREPWVAAAREALATYPLNDETALGLLAGTTFYQPEILEVLLAAAPAGDHTELVLLAVGQADTDRRRLELLTPYAELLAVLPLARRQAVLEAFDFDSSRDEAAVLLGVD